MDWKSPQFLVAVANTRAALGHERPTALPPINLPNQRMILSVPQSRDGR